MCECKNKIVLEYNAREAGTQGKKAPKSGTPNPNPKRGSSKNPKGAAGKARGYKVSSQDAKALSKKVSEFNEKYKTKLGYGVTLGKLKSVFGRGMEAFQTSHSPKVKSSTQWAHARVNAFLYLMRAGRPKNPKYVQDNDLLPKKHPKKSKMTANIIKKENGKYCLYSKKGKKLGTFDTKEQAVKREKQIQYFKINNELHFEYKTN